MRVVTAFHLGGVSGPSRSLLGVMGWLHERGDELTFLVPEEGASPLLAPIGATNGLSPPSPAAVAVDVEYRDLGEVTTLPYSALTRPRGPRASAAAARAFARDVLTFRRELRRRRADLLVVVTTVLPAALVAARIERVPAVVYAAEAHPGRSGGALTRGTAALGSGVVCCSRLVAEQFRRGTRPLAVAYPPIGERHAHGDREAGRRLLGCEGADPLVAVVGSLSRGRGQDLAIRALPAIRKEAESARLVLVGDPHPRGVDREYAADLRALAAELGVAGSVAFPGAIAELSDLYAAADVVMNPARVPESFGRVAAEAVLAGRPVVSADVGAVREVLRDGVDGVLVPPERPDALAAAVLELWRDPEHGRRLASAGAERVRAEFGREQDLAAWRSVIEAVAARTPRGR